MTLLDIIPIWATILAIILAISMLSILMRFRVVHSVADPNILAFFQITFTFFILLFLRDLLFVDFMGFLLFYVLLLKFSGSAKTRSAMISQNDWVSFSKLFSIALLILNIYLLSQKGLLLLAANVSDARVDFYQGWGLFKRFNDIGIGFTAITAAVLWHERRRKQAVLIASFSAYLALTLGSRSGLLACLLAYGAYLHFSDEKISNKRIMLAGTTLGLSSLFIFFIMFGPQFLGASAYRVVGYSDGPVYFFHDQMYRYSDYPLSYPLDELLTDLRLQPYYESPPSNKPLPLGRFIDLHHFGADTPLLGPNPQIFVEAHAAFHWLSIFWYIMIASIFTFLRKRSTPYSFFLGCYIAGPLLIDSQLAGSQLFSVMLLIPLVFGFILLKRLIGYACTDDSRKLIRA